MTREAGKIAARLRPEAKDLRLTALGRLEAREGRPEAARQVPASGYVGPYPLQERGEEEDGEER